MVIGIDSKLKVYLILYQTTWWAPYGCFLSVVVAKCVAGTMKTVFVRLFLSCFLGDNLASVCTPNITTTKGTPRCNVYRQKCRILLNRRLGTVLYLWDVLIFQDSTVTVKCRTAIKSLFLYFTLSIMLDIVFHVYLQLYLVFLIAKG